MNKQQKEWLDYYIESGDHLKAVEVAYPDVSKENRSSKASRLKTQLADEIDKRGRELYGKEAPQMMQVIKDLALTAKQESVKLKAASEWLSRAKHDAPLQVDISDSRTFEQLQNQLKEQLTQVDDNTLTMMGLSREALEGLTSDRKDH